MSDLQYFNNDEWFQYAENINSYTDLGLVVGRVQKPIMPAVQESVQDVPGMYGNIFMGNDYGELTFNIPVTIMAFDHTSYNIMIENMRSVFTQDASDPGKEYPLEFGDRPGVKYYGHWGQISEPTFISPNDWQARATLTFICSQPYGYMNQQDMEIEFPNQTIIPQGTGETYPIYQIYLKQDIYNVGFTNNTAGGDYVATGYTVDDMNTDTEGNRIKDKMPLDTDEEPTTLNDWIADGTENKELLTFRMDGDQGGQMSERDGKNGITPGFVNHTDKNRSAGQQSVQTRNYGDPKKHTNWYGPLAIHPQFNNPTNDWRLMVNLWNQKCSTDHTSDRAMGYCVIYLLDENGHRRGRIWIHDLQKGEMPRVGFTLGKNDQDEVEMINDNGSSSGWTGPQKVGNYNYRRERNYPRGGVVIKSIHNYKQLVYNSKKAKAAASKKQRGKNRKNNASKRWASQQAASKRKYGNRRHEKHHYRKRRGG